MTKHIVSPEATFDNVFCPATDAFTTFTTNTHHYGGAQVDYCPLCMEAEPELVETSEAILDRIAELV